MFKIVCLHFYRLLASLSCYYDVNPVVALSGPNGVIGISAVVNIFALTGNLPCKYNNQFMVAGERTGVNGKS